MYCVLWISTQHLLNFRWPLFVDLGAFNHLFLPRNSLPKRRSKKILETLKFFQKKLGLIYVFGLSEKNIYTQMKYNLL